VSIAAVARRHALAKRFPLPKITHGEKKKNPGCFHPGFSFFPDYPLRFGLSGNRQEVKGKRKRQRQRRSKSTIYRLQGDDFHS
jgi:hypothetical protein